MSEFKEQDHPRAKDGKFTSKGNGNATGSTNKVSTPEQRKKYYEDKYAGTKEYTITWTADGLKGDQKTGVVAHDEKEAREKFDRMYSNMRNKREFKSIEEEKENDELNKFVEENKKWEYDPEVIEKAESFWVRNKNDEKVWNSLTDYEKNLLGIASDFNHYNEWVEQISKDKNTEKKYNELKNKFSHSRKPINEEKENEKNRDKASKLFDVDL